MLRESLGAYDAHLKDARNRERVGTAARNEVLAVQVERDRAELSLLGAQESVAVAEANLQRLLDLPAGTRVETAEALESAAPAADDAVALADAALAARPERAAALARADGRAEARIRGEQGARLPQVAVGGRVRLREPEPADPAAGGRVGPHLGRRR